MFTPSLVFAYWICGSMAQPFYDMAGLRLARGSQRQKRELDAARLQSVCKRLSVTTLTASSCQWYCTRF